MSSLYRLRISTNAMIRKQSLNLFTVVNVVPFTETSVEPTHRCKSFSLCQLFPHWQFPLFHNKSICSSSFHDGIRQRSQRFATEGSLSGLRSGEGVLALDANMGRRAASGSRKALSYRDLWRAQKQRERERIKMRIGVKKKFISASLQQHGPRRTGGEHY